MAAALLRSTRLSASQRSTTQRGAIGPCRPAHHRIGTRERAVVMRAAEETSFDSEKLIKDLQAKWDALDNKPQFLIYSAGALAGVWFTAVVLGAVDRVPLIPKALELVGLGYSAYFIYRYLLFKANRVELIKEVEGLKERITGPE